MFSFLNCYIPFQVPSSGVLVPALLEFNRRFSREGTSHSSGRYELKDSVLRWFLGKRDLDPVRSCKQTETKGRQRTASKVPASPLPGGEDLVLMRTQHPGEKQELTGRRGKDSTG